jgi:lipopolysaccharide/colanic/teichoic acid biosynthesis glycosyltransferase
MVTANSQNIALNALSANFQEFGAHPSMSCKVKRCIDIVGALVGLAITALLFIPIAIAIYLDNPGPIVYSHMRCGYRGKLFRMWKFRTMVTNADALKHQIQNNATGPTWKCVNDPRVTRVGAFLRSTSLDEFPQFWNVLRGEMSLVGPRPAIANEVVDYKPHHWKRVNVKPGLTCEWQVRGRSQVLDFDEILELDLQYQRQWNVLYDIGLVLRTIQAVLSRSGAH